MADDKKRSRSGDDESDATTDGEPALDPDGTDTEQASAGDHDAPADAGADADAELDTADDRDERVDDVVTDAGAAGGDGATDGDDADGAGSGADTGASADDARDDDDDASAPAATAGGQSHQGLGARLYLGTSGLDIVGQRKLWYRATAVVVLVCVLGMVFRGFSPGIEFVGGTNIKLPANSAEGTIDADEASDVFTDTLGREPASSQAIGTGNAAAIEIRSEELNNAETAEVKQALFDELRPLDANGEPSVNAISDDAVSGTWGGEISQQALIALGVFLVLVAVFLTLYFERRMAFAALTALAFDLIVTAGVYSIVGLEVTPGTVIGLLTILGYSLYDTVVVFDKIKERSRGILNLSRSTFPEAANTALNQVLMRSINTTVTSLLPVLALLIIGAGLLGAGTLKDLALVMSIGVLAGAISSIFLATPVLVDMKMRQPEYQEQARKVASRRASRRQAVAQRSDAAAADLDDTELEAELRQEKAYAAASAVPGRNLKKIDRFRRRKAANEPESTAAQPTGKSGRPSGKSSAQPAGKGTGRPTGKRGR